MPCYDFEDYSGAFLACLLNAGDIADPDTVGKPGIW